MICATWDKVDDYITEHLIPYDEVLERVLQIGRPDCRRLMYLRLKGSAEPYRSDQGCKRILEIGTLGGYSTIWMARAIGDGGG